ncbi:cysteine--tRNA ligase [Candidatus Woesearchaeota archaeon]|nr:cysteine--tRNA ligase [Candidatus Woesearchaeota archaeon]
MVLKLYNSLTNKLEEFIPVIPGKVRMYNCGPTVYSYQHIGNFRAFVFADLLRRVFKYKGFEVVQVMNITDVGHLTDDGDDGEDKLDVAARKEKKHPLEIARFYTEQFLADWNALRLQDIEFRPKATETITEIIELISVLLEKGHAYQASGNVYYDVTSFPNYGKLSGNSLDKLTKNRVAKDPNKKNANDFVLWFGESKYENHILKWDSPWGEGYPGWHMECSAMSAKFLTEAFADKKLSKTHFQTIDIHTGGEDNKFPHHECEIAQSEGVFDKQYVHYWLHPAFLQVEGGKMSKSAGTVYYVFDLIKEGFSWRAIRYLLLSAHYRQTLNFTKEGLQAASQSLARIDDTLKKLQAVRSEQPYSEQLGKAINVMKLVIEQELDNDLNISGALGALFEAIKIINKALDEGMVGDEQAKEILTTMMHLDGLFGFLPPELLDDDEVPAEVADLLSERATARNKKDWGTSDSLRDALKEKGYEVRDTPRGQELRKL